MCQLASKGTALRRELQKEEQMVLLHAGRCAHLSVCDQKIPEEVI